jgi:hypothetical protein
MLILQDSCLIPFFFSKLTQWHQFSTMRLVYFGTLGSILIPNAHEEVDAVDQSKYPDCWI